jgi:hypothetical protein
MALDCSYPCDARRFADCAVDGSGYTHTCARAHSQEPRSQPRRPRLTERDLKNPIKMLEAFDYILREAWAHAPEDAEYRNRLPIEYIGERLLQMLPNRSEATEISVVVALVKLERGNHLQREGDDLVMPSTLRRRA